MLCLYLAGQCSLRHTDRGIHSMDDTGRKRHTAEGSEAYSYFSNRKCPYFPCHAGADPDNFNCLFCYCPLYLLGRHCGGSFRYNEKGVKVCTNCLFPHKRENYPAVTKMAFGRMRQVLHLADCLDSIASIDSSESVGAVQDK